MAAKKTYREQVENTSITNPVVTPLQTPTNQNQTTQTNTAQAPDKLGGIGVFRDKTTGAPSGVELPNGKIFLGLSPDEVQAIADRENKKMQSPQGTQEVGALIAQQKQQQLGRQLSEQVGQTTPVNDGVQTQGLDVGQALMAGAGNIIPQSVGALATTGAIMGAGIGLAPVTAGISIPVSVGVSALVGFITGVRNSLASQTADDIQTSATSLRKREILMKSLISDTNKRPENAQENLMFFNEQLSLAERDWGNLNLKSKAELTKFLGKDGSSQLARYELFYSAGGTKEQLIRNMHLALLNPNPNAPDLITTSEMEDNQDLLD